MGLAASKEGGLPNRLTRFRELRARLDPAGDPGWAFSRGLYVHAPGSVSERLTAELSLKPSSTHLLIGGVGSGKTTELLSTRRRLNELSDMRAFYVDVSEQHDIGEMTPGAVLVQAGLALAEGFLKHTEATAEEREALSTERTAAAVALGHLGDLGDGVKNASRAPSREDDGLIRVPGILIPPVRFESEVARVTGLLDGLLRHVRRRWGNVIVLLDGLDRMTDLTAFEKVITQDVAALSSRGVGVVLVGPLRANDGLDRATVAQHFDDRVHYQPWLDPNDAATSSEILVNVLLQRLPVEATVGAAAVALVTHSGGVLRDLLSLAQSACVEAYMHGSDGIGVREVEAAIDAFGRKHMQGLRPAELEVLRRVLEKGTFVHTSEDDLALLLSRRVLEYRSDGRPRYAVHPTIVPFLRDAT